MTEAKSKRDLIWEEKRRQREERLLRMEGQIQDNNENQFQLPPPRLDDQVPISFPSQSQEYEPYIPPEPYVPIEMNRNPEPPRMYQGSIPQQSDFREQRDKRSNSQFQQQPAIQQSPLKNPIKQQQDDYREYLKKQMEEKETEKKRRRDGTNNNQQQIQQVQFQQQSNNPAPLPAQPINRQKQEYGEFLRQQMMEKEEQKKRRIQSGNNQNNQQQQQQYQQQQMQQYQVQQQPQQYQQQIYQPQQFEINQGYSQGNQQSITPYQQQQPQQVDQNKQQKQEYGDYLRMQMQLKEQEKNDRKKNLQQRMETGDAFPFGKGGGGAPYQRGANNQIPQNYNQQQQYQPQSYNQQQQNQQPNYQQQPQYIQQQQNFQQPIQQIQYQQSIVTPQQYQYQEQNLPSGFDQQPILMEPLVDPQQKGGRNRLMLENQNIDDIKKKELQKLEMQRVLQEQIEEKKRKKEQERLQKEMEDRQEEERFRRQKEQEEMEKKREEDSKKYQQGKFEQDNIDLKEKKRLERIQERKNRKNQQQEEDQPQQNFQVYEQQQQLLPPPSRNPPPSQPKSENYLKEFLMNEKMKEGVSPHQSILDFYRNGPQPINKAEIQQNREIDDIKRQMLQQQENLQQQIQQVMSQAQMAIEGRNKAEQELISLKEQVKNKYLQEERHHDDLMIALVKNDPKWEKQVFPPHLLAQAEVGAYKDLSMPALNENFNFPNLNQNRAAPQFAPAYESKPLVLKEESKEQKQYFREQFGLQSLVSDSNMVPIDHNASLVPQMQPLNKKVSEIQLDKIDELNAHFEDSLKLGIGENYQIRNDNFKKRPPSNNGQNQSWNVPSIDSEFVKEIDDLLKYKPAQQTLNRPPSGFNKNGYEQRQLQQSTTNRPPSQTNQRPPSAFGRAALGVLGSADLNYKGITLDSEFPDMTMLKKGTNTETFDIAGIHKRMDQKLMHLNEIEEDEDLQKLDKLLYQYN
ncbi:unnamed protein product [Paramecium pentaurelia]|uniref:Uncharacterized protein n=1 Tax=Paramecium pentaurelia TaxID=43138 RepID=A0A8S1THH0_9CILI|nr:unnamed protein product [Paramecium pentaurelia]